MDLLDNKQKGLDAASKITDGGEELVQLRDKFFGGQVVSNSFQNNRSGNRISAIFDTVQDLNQLAGAANAVARQLGQSLAHNFVQKLSASVPANLLVLGAGRIKLRAHPQAVHFRVHVQHELRGEFVVLFLGRGVLALQVKVGAHLLKHVAAEENNAQRALQPFGQIMQVGENHRLCLADLIRS